MSWRCCDSDRHTMLSVRWDSVQPDESCPACQCLDARRERDEAQQERDAAIVKATSESVAAFELSRQLAAANRALTLIAPVIEEAMVFCGDEWFEHESWWREETKPWHTFQQLNQQTALLASDRDAIDVMRTVARAAEGGER